MNEIQNSISNNKVKKVNKKVITTMLKNQQT